MDKQRGGSFRVSGYIALALLALTLFEAAAIRHLYAHRTIQILMPTRTALRDCKAGMIFKRTASCGAAGNTCWKCA